MRAYVLNAVNARYIFKIGESLGNSVPVTAIPPDEVSAISIGGIKKVATRYRVVQFNYDKPKDHLPIFDGLDLSDVYLALDPTFSNEDDLIKLGALVPKFAGIYTEVGHQFLLDAGFVRDEEKDVWRFVGKPKPKTKPKAKPDADEASEEVSE